MLEISKRFGKINSKYLNNVWGTVSVVLATDPEAGV
jgi:hypothetical protein